MRILFLAAATLALAAPVAVAQSQPASMAVPARNAELAAFFDAYDKASLELSPLAKTQRGIRDGDYGAWGDFSDVGDRAQYELGQRTLADMRRRFQPAQLTGQDLLSYRLFERQMERQRAAWAYRDYDFTFDQMNGAQSQLPAFLINQHRIGNRAEAEAYVSRLERMGAAIDQTLEQAEGSEKIGVMPPRWVYPYVIADSRNIVTGAPFGPGADSPLWADLKSKVGALDLPQAEKDALLERGRKALTGVVGPAYQRVIAFHEAQGKRAPAGDGVWRFKDGAKYYAERLAFYTTTDLTPAQVHQLGLDQVARIHGEMREVQKRIGFQGPLQDFFKHMRERPQNYYPNTAEGRTQYLAETDKAIKAMQAKLPEYFSAATLPKAPLNVKAVEAFREKSAGKAFYQRPAPDGSRPGVYYVNLYDMKDMPNIEVEALAYHEGVPGHHLDGAVTTNIPGLPPFRRFGGFTAWSEGWGLYSELLGKDMGFYTDPYRDFGRLQLELHRAIRLVVDSGLHDKRWSREKAIQYVLDNSADAPGGVVKAIERYAVYPGQATAYMVGRLKITELRDKARAELGERFRMADFHDAVLLSGRVPLDVLEANVDAYIARTKGGTAVAG